MSNLLIRGAEPSDIIDQDSVFEREDLPRSPIFEKPTSGKMGIVKYQVYRDVEGHPVWVAESTNIGLNQADIYSVWGPGTYQISAFGKNEKHLQDATVEISGDREEWEAAKAKKNGKKAIDPLTSLILEQVKTNRELLKMNQEIQLKNSDTQSSWFKTYIDDGALRSNENIRLAEMRAQEEAKRMEAQIERVKLEHMHLMEQQDARWQREEEARLAREESRMREMEQRMREMDVRHEREEQSRLAREELRLKETESKATRELQMQREAFMFQQSMMEKKSDQSERFMMTMLEQAREGKGPGAMVEAMQVIEHAKGLVSPNENREKTWGEVLVEVVPSILGAFAQAKATVTPKQISSFIRANPQIGQRIVRELMPALDAGSRNDDTPVMEEQEPEMEQDQDMPQE